MTDHAEEQEMEAEALAAIFDTHFIGGDKQWKVDLYPEQQASDDNDELQQLNHVAIQLQISLPEQYPDVLPELKVHIVKGLAEDPHGVELQALAVEEAQANEGVPSIFAVCERLREWLMEHNRPGLDDTSAYATMMRKQEQAAQQQKKASQAFEAQTAQEEMTAAELEEIAVRKRRAEGTPCDKENFEAWKARFEAEMQQAKQEQTLASEDAKAKGGIKAAVADGNGQTKMTGFDYFSGKTTNLEALEAAAEQAGEAEEEAEATATSSGVVNEELFDDDVDLDDLDFDDDEDDDDEELDI